MRKLFALELIGFVCVSIAGTLAHFFFEWSNYSTAVGIFTPVNESIWEHLKLIFFPYIIWSLSEYFILKRPKGFFTSRLLGVIAGMAATVAVFYIYTGATGKSSAIVNIGSFFIGSSVSFLVSYLSLKNSKTARPSAEIASSLLLIITGLLFALFTFAPPLIPLFEDPLTFTYGI